MNNPPPPPSDNLPTPPSVPDHIPPPPGTEEHVNDVLERRKKFSWKSFGGDGFLVSVAFHVLLAIIAIFYIVSRYKAPDKKSDPEVFETGAGGGANGDKPKAFEQKMQTRRTNVKMPTRITSKSTSSITLPDTPQTSTASFASGLTSGGMSKGSGGGSGGGEGTGIGIGKGGGRNFVSLFGARGAGAEGLPGTFYDAKQSPDGKPSKYAEDTGNEAFGNDVLRRFFRSWNTDQLDKNFFRAPEKLYAGQIFIPKQDAAGAPAAYGVADKVKPRRWLAHYKGAVIAPKSGKFRFWGLADDVLAVRWEGRNVIDSGQTLLSEPGSFTHGNFAATATRSILGSKVNRKGAFGAHFHASVWIEVTKGREYPLELIIAEVPGGAFGAWLMMEESDSSGKEGGGIFLFRMTEDALPPGIRDDTGLDVDMSGKNLIWKAVSRKSSVR